MLAGLWSMARQGDRAAFDRIERRLKEALASSQAGGGDPAAVEPWVTVTDWEIVGPFPLFWNQAWRYDGRTRVPESLSGLRYTFPPERQPADYRVFDTLDGQLGWRHVGTGSSGALDLRPRFRTTDNVLCYARTRIHAARSARTVLGLGFNDGGKVFLNGEQVASFQLACKDPGPRDHLVPIALESGVNELLVKAYNLGAEWELRADVLDPLGELSVRAEY